jgi:hypothetical protein
LFSARHPNTAAVLVSLVLIVAGVIVVAAQLATPGPEPSLPRSQRAALRAGAATARTTEPDAAPARATTTTTIPATTTSTTPPSRTTTTTTTTAPVAPTTTPTSSATHPTVAAAQAPDEASAVPAIGRATAWGCAAALAYLQAYAAKGFTLECPGDAEGHDAMTCLAEQGACPSSAVIAIADPCPEAYMNEANNSWVLLGASDAPIDPYGACPS